MATTVRRVLATVVVVVVVLMVRSWRRFIPFGQIHLAVAVVSGRVLSLIVRLIVFLHRVRRHARCDRDPLSVSRYRTVLVRAR
uniref:Putative secreted peptide n=1 Tax=Anopheles braziliensis TaxID=58242 RepID=A0A2M3ZUF6_9DIPT